MREKDLKRFLLLSPNAPRIWLALLVRDRVRDAYWNDLELARLNLVALETLRELDLGGGNGFDISGSVSVEYRSSCSFVRRIFGGACGKRPDRQCGFRPSVG